MFSKPGLWSPQRARNELLTPSVLSRRREQIVITSGWMMRSYAELRLMKRRGAKVARVATVSKRKGAERR